jgi:hypothetical protein
LRALWSRAKAEKAKSRVVKTAAVIAVVEYVLINSFQGLPYWGCRIGIQEHAQYRSGENGDAVGIRGSGGGCRGILF